MCRHFCSFKFLFVLCCLRAFENVNAFLRFGFGCLEFELLTAILETLSLSKFKDLAFDTCVMEFPGHI